MTEITDSRRIPVEARPSRALKDRHLQLMGMGSAIGAGFFLSSGSAIHQSGPGLLLAYLFAGTVVYLVMRALGELALAYPSAGSFTAYAAMFQGPLAGFIMGSNLGELPRFIMNQAILKLNLNLVPDTPDSHPPHARGSIKSLAGTESIHLLTRNP